MFEVVNWRDGREEEGMRMLLHVQRRSWGNRRGVVLGRSIEGCDAGKDRARVFGGGKRGDEMRRGSGRRERASERRSAKDQAAKRRGSGAQCMRWAATQKGAFVILRYISSHYFVSVGTSLIVSGWHESEPYSVQHEQRILVMKEPIGPTG